MGCCMSSEEPVIYEVVIDENDVAQRVPKGQGTHFIHVSDDGTHRLVQKPQTKVPFEVKEPGCPDPVYTKKPTMMPWNIGKAKRASVAPVCDEKTGTQGK